MSDTVERMPLAELELTQEYQRLTPKQKLFVSNYVAGGILDGVYDSVASCNVAYRCKSVEVARIMSYSLMQNIRIVAVLNRHFNTTPIEAFLIQVDRAILNKNLTTAQLGALKVKADLLGYAARLPSVDRQGVGIIPPDVLEAEKKKRKRTRKSYAMVKSNAPVYEPD